MPLPLLPTIEPHDATEPDVAFVLELAHALHAAGTPAHRLEAAMADVSDRLGLQTQFFSTPTVIIVGIGPTIRQQVSLLRVEPGDQGLEALERLDHVVSLVAAGKIDVEEAVALVRSVRHAPQRYGPAVTALAYVVASSASARFLNGGWREITTAGVIGLGVGALVLLGRRKASIARVVEPVAALGAAVLAPAASLLFGRMSTLTATIAGVISLIPGLALTTALTELATRHLTAGTSRLVGAMAVFLTLGLGVALGHQAVELLPHVTEARHSLALPHWTEWLALGIAPIASAVQLRAMPRQFGWILLAGATAWLAARSGGQLLGPELGAFLAALLLATVSNLYARWLDRPASVLIVPGILMLVPGSIGFRSVNWLLQQDVVHGLRTAMQLAVIAVALVGGLLFANVIVPPRRAT
jgi:uncharacterized membrane protein YjjP (DUF1212 family)